MYLSDCHTHSQISFDSVAPLSAMAEAAIAAGVDELCVTDHCDLLDPDGTPCHFFDWPAARTQYQRLLPKVEGRLTLRLGIELASIPADPAAARSILRQGGADVDFVLGSLHNWIGQRNNCDLYYTDYTGNFPLCCQAMENVLDNTWRMVTQYPDCYDSLAHLIYPARYMRRDGQILTMDRYEEPIRAIFTEIARTDHAIEVNTWRGIDIHPWLPLLRWYRECGGKYVTFGSDAHDPADVAKGLREILPLMEAAGFTHVTTYEKRRPTLHKL